jgi:hypothetical protein
MKRKLFVQLFFTIIGLLLFLPASAQRYAKSQFTLIAYEYEIDNKVKNDLYPLESYFKYNCEKGQNIIEATLISTVYGIVVQKMDDSLGCNFMPINTFTDKVKYNSYGYPDITIQKAIRLGDTKFYMRIILKVENEETDNEGKKTTEDIIRPKVTITLEIYDKNGFEPIQVIEGSASAVQAVKLTPEFIVGMNFADPTIKRKINSETLSDIINRAMLSALEKTKKTKKHK